MKFSHEENIVEEIQVERKLPYFRFILATTSVLVSFHVTETKVMKKPTYSRKRLLWLKVGGA